MRIEAYLRIVNDEAAIRAVHAHTNVPGASIKQLKAPKTAGSDDMWWHWTTRMISIDPYDPDQGLKGFLTSLRPIFTIIRTHGGHEPDIHLEVITKYEKGDAPFRLSISAETISLLSELGAALDNDVETYREKHNEFK